MNRKLTLSVSSSTLYSDSNTSKSNTPPVMRCDPDGISSTVYLNCATNSPAKTGRQARPTQHNSAEMPNKRETGIRGTAKVLKSKK